MHLCKYRRCRLTASWGVASGFILAVGLSGCAIVNVTDDGRKQVFGFVALELHEKGQAAGYDHVEVANIGVLAYATPVSSGVSVGVSELKMIGLGDNTIVGKPW